MNGENEFHQCLKDKSVISILTAFVAISIMIIIIIKKLKKIFSISSQFILNP